MCNAQRTRKPNHVLYDGPCRLRCPMSLMYDPVCGSDGVDYPNSEALSCAALRDSTLVAVKRGPCRAQEAGASCKRMVQRRGGGDTPVCATNGVTYANHEAVICLREFNPGLRIRHDGPCRLLDVDMRPLDEVRVCHTADYTPLWLPVCATDGHTYSNPFVLVCAQARKIMASDVTIRHAGECGQSGGDGEVREDDSSNEDACRRAAEMPALIDRPLFCANDGRTYYNHPHYACAVQRDGDWFPYRIVRLNMPCDAADHPCERLRLVPDALRVDPICGSDGLTYASPLALMCAMANREGLRRHHRGPCLNSNEEDHGERQQTTTDVAVNKPGGEGEGDESDFEDEDNGKDENKKGGSTSSAGDENTDKPNTETEDTTEIDEDVEEIDVDNVTPRRTVVVASLTIR